MGSITQMKTQTSPHPVPKIEEITPALARKYLATMIRQRPQSDAKVLEYAIAMDEKRWSLNGETIKFDSEGRMFDGQHRCMACVLSEKPFITWVIRGVDDPRAYATVDVGIARSVGHIFGMSGWADPKIVAGVATLLYLYKNNNLAWSGPVNVRNKRATEFTSRMKRTPSATHTVQRDKLQEFASGIREDLSSAVRYAQNSKAKRFVPVGTVGAAYYLFREKDAMEADRFMEDLAEGIGLLRSDPVHAVREKLISMQKNSVARMNRWAVFGMLIKAWNKRRAGEKMSVVRILDNEAYPKVK